MRIRKLMAVLFAVVLMVGILPTHIFAESTNTDITIHHTTGQLYREIPIASGSFVNSITSITVVGGTMDLTDWNTINSTLKTEKNVTKVDLSGTSSSGSTQETTFYNISSLKTVLLPSDLTSIGDSDFYGCTGLTSITIPETVTAIGGSAFCGCTGFTSFTIPKNVTAIGSSAFSGCTGLTSITIPEKVTSAIGDYAFSGCTNLSSVSILGSVASIGNYAFMGCTKLSSITIPQSVTAIGDEAFYGCTNLYPVTFDGTPKITRLGKFSFAKDTSLTKISIPSSVTSIGDDAFSECTNLSTVTVNSSTPCSMGVSVFDRTASDTVLNVPEGSENNWDKSDGVIDHLLRVNAKQLRIENLPPLLRCRIFRISDTEATIGIKSDEDGVYYYAIAKAGDPAPTIDTTGAGKPLNAEPIDVTNLSAGPYKLYIKAKDLNEHMTSDADAAVGLDIESYFSPVSVAISKHTAGNFASELTQAMSDVGISTSPYLHYNQIKSLTVSGGVFSDDDWKALSAAHTKDGNGNAVYMINAATIDLSGVSSTSSVPDAMFAMYPLQNVALPSGISGLGRSVFEDCENLTSVIIPSSVRTIGRSAFSGCASLTSIVIPSGVTTIGDDAFSGCTSLTSVTIPSGMTAIVSGAFAGCSRLASITIPSSVTSIGDSAFADCSSLASITSLAANPPKLEEDGSNFFSNLPSTGTLTVPSGSVSTYTSEWGTSLPEHWTITAAGTPAPQGGGSSSGNSTYYNANISVSGSQTSLPVTVDAGSKTASFDMGSQSFSQAGTVITVPSIPNVHTYSAKISVSDLSRGAAQGTLTVKTGNGNITIPSNMLASGTSGSKTSISFGQGDKTALPASVQAALGSHPLIQLSMAIDGKQTEWNNPNAPVTVSIPYTPTAAELNNTDSIVIWYIDGSGKAVCVPSGHYDAATGTVTFKTTHFSSYAVCYNDINFTDVSGWYADYVNYLAARDIINGTGNGKFSPDANITRAEFVTILARMSGDNLSGYTSSVFSDASSSDWYSAAVQWAYQNGIASGYDSKFSPNANITREQMAVMLYRYAKHAGVNVSNVEGMSVREFSDFSSISNWALTPIQWVINDKIVSGNSDGSFAPQANATRAQAAKMIAVLLQGMIGG